MFHNNSILFAELVIILLVILIQLIHSLKVFLNIRKLQGIFDETLTVKNGFVEREHLKDPDSVLKNMIIPSDEASDMSGKYFARITYTETDGTNEIILRIKKSINTYLANNYGAAVNFSIIKDLIDREVDLKDEEITQSLPTPLYLGLAATMVGIIFGLYAMPDVNGGNFAEGINKLIEGVKWAMTASLSGLFCTTMLSSFVYKKAKGITLQKKNLQLSYLQAKLLPELVKAEDTGVSGLKASLDRFAREATVIVNDVNLATIQTGTNIKSQNDLIARLERLNMTKVSKANLELFDRLERNREAFDNFSAYLSNMEAIAANLKDFAMRTSNVDKVTEQIGQSMLRSQELTRFLTAHFEKIEMAGASALRAVDLSDSHFRESIESLTKRTNSGIEDLFSFSDKKESDLKELFEKITETLKEVTSRHISEFMSAYSQAVPQFKQLDNLETLASRSELIITNSEKSNKAILAKLDELDSKLVSLNDHSPAESVETAIQNLSGQLTGKKLYQNSGGKRLFRIFETSLRILALGLIVVVCAGLILRYFRII